MTIISDNKTLDELEHPMDTLAYIKSEFQTSSMSNPDNMKNLCIELCELIERILKNQNDMRRDKEEEEEFEERQISNGGDNFDLDTESVKKIILKEVSVGQIFYPSDIANEHGLDLQTVIQVMNELKETKQIIEKTGKWR